MIVLPPLAA